MTETNRYAGEAFFTSPLYTLLHDHFPQFHKPNRSFDVPGLAAAIGYSHEGVYKWLRAGKVSFRGAESIVKLSEKGKKPLTMGELRGFLTFR